MIIRFPLDFIIKNITRNSATQEYYLAKVEYNNALQKPVTEADFFRHAAARLEMATEVLHKVKV